MISTELIMRHLYEGIVFKANDYRSRVINKISSELCVVLTYPLQIEKLMRDMNTLYPGYMSRPWLTNPDAATDGSSKRNDGGIAVSRRTC